jgi:hypothetical protein
MSQLTLTEDIQQVVVKINRLNRDKVNKNFADDTAGYVIGDFTLAHTPNTNDYVFHKIAESVNGEIKVVYDFNVPIGSTTDGGLYSKEDASALVDLSERMDRSEGKSSRYAHDFGATEPTADDVDDYAQSLDLEEPYAGVAIVNTHDYTIWHWYTDTADPLTGHWQNDGSDTVSKAAVALTLKIG